MKTSLARLRKKKTRTAHQEKRGRDITLDNPAEKEADTLFKVEQPSPAISWPRRKRRRQTSGPEQLICVHYSRCVG